MLQSLAIMFLFGLMFGRLFNKLRLPSLIGFMLVGILLGPHVLNQLDDVILLVAADLRSLALIVILLRAGLSLDLDDLKAIGRPAVLMSFIPACFEMMGTIVLSRWLFGLSLLDATILASVLASASPAVIVPRMIRLIEEGYGTQKRIPQLILAADSVDDIFNIVVFTALLGLTSGEQLSYLHLFEVPLSIGTGVLAGSVVGYLLVLLFRQFHIRDSSKIIILLSVAFLLAGAEALAIPFSGLVSVIVLGVVLLKLRPVVAKRLSVKFAKLWVGAEVLLFVLVGASVDISVVSKASVNVILMLVVVLVMRAMGIFLCLVGTDLTLKERQFCALTGIPKATVQAAIGGIPLAMGLASGEFILAAAVVSILCTAPVGAWLIDNRYPHLLKKTKG